MSRLSSFLMDRSTRFFTALVAIVLIAAIPTQAAFAAQTLTSVGVGAQTGVLSYGTPGSVTYTVTVTCTGVNPKTNPVTVNLSVSGLPTGVTSSGFSTNPVTFAASGCAGGGTKKTSTLTLNTTASALAGSTAFTVTGDAGGGSTQSGNGNLLIGTRSITVTAATNTKPYDGTTSAAATPTLTSGTLAAGDTGIYAEAYTTAAVGTGKTLIPSATIMKSSTDVTSSYSITFVNNATGVISKGTPTISVTNSPVTYNGVAQTPVVTGSVPGAVGNLSVGGAATQTNAGTYAVTASFTPTDTTNYNSLPAGTSAGNFVIGKATPILSVSSSSMTYTGDPQTVNVTADVLGSVSNVLVGGASSQTNAGTYPVTADFAPADPVNYNSRTGGSAGSYTINKANAAVTVTAYSATYDGNPHTASGSALGVKGESLSGLLLAGTTHTNAGDYAVDGWAFTDVTGNYNDASGSVHDSIAKANATIVVTPYSVTYDKVAHTATSSATGAKGEALTGLVVSGTTHTNAGDYPNDPWTFTDSTSNYNNSSGSVHDVIAKAAASCTVNGFTGTYDGTAHGATGGCTGIGGENPGTLDLGSSFTNAPGGTAHWSLIGGSNYADQSGDAPIVLNKADAVISVNGYTGVYDGSAHGASGSAHGVEAAPANLNSLLDLGVSFTNVPGGTAHWVFAGNTNYNAANGDVAIVLGKANATITVTPYTITYDGTIHTAGSTAKGVLNESLAGLNLSGTSHTNAGNYTGDAWTFTDVTGNYNDASGTVDDSIAKANADITVTEYHVPYDGAAHTATGSATGVLDESLSGLDLTGTTHTDTGDYPLDPWTFTDTTGNYNNSSGTVHDSIGKTVATVTLGDLSQTYNGTPRPVSATTDPTGLTVVFTYDGGATVPTNAGSYAVTAAIVDANYIGSDSGTLVVAKADATCTINGYTGVYDKAAHGASGSCSGINSETPGTLALGDSFTDVPGGTAHWTLTGNGNYNDQSGDVSVTISKAAASCTVNGYSGTYDAASHGASGSCSGVGGEVAGTLDLGSSFTNVSGGTAHWSLTGNINYNDQSGDVAITINAATPTIHITGGTPTYDGNPHPASATATGVLDESVSGSFTFLYNGLSTEPVVVGSYDVTASFTSSDANYTNNSAPCPACIVISAENLPPTFTSTAVTAAKVGTLYTYNITASDPEHDALTITVVTSLPAWLSFTDHGDGTATLTGTPALANMGSQLVTLHVSDGPHSAEQSFTLNPERTVTLYSNKTYDGWVLESGENTSKGGSMNSSLATFNLGDDSAKRQYRGILSFNTRLPAGATVTQITLKVKQAGKPVGINPFLKLGNIMVDVKRGTFGVIGLQLTDFQQSVGTAGKLNAMTIKKPPFGLWYSATLTGTLPNTLVNKTGNTQFRLHFSKDDNNDLVANYLMFYTGNSVLANQPVLAITYHLP